MMTFRLFHDTDRYFKGVWNDDNQYLISEIMTNGPDVYGQILLEYGVRANEWIIVDVDKQFIKFKNEATFTMIQVALDLCNNIQCYSHRKTGYTVRLRRVSGLNEFKPFSVNDQDDQKQPIYGQRDNIGVINPIATGLVPEIMGQRGTEVDKQKRYKRIIHYNDDDEDVGLLGHGTFGEVYKAHDQKTGVIVAVKRVKLSKLEDHGLTIREFKRQIKTEKETMEKCDSPHIVKLLDYYEKGGKTGKLVYIVMEYCPGGNLKDFISAQRGLKESVARGFACQIKEALISMRSLDIVHRDLKPENIVLTERTERAILKITDFGTATVKRYDQQTGATILKSFVGTHGYMAPEVRSKNGVADDSIYNSTGNVLFYFSLIALC